MYLKIPGDSETIEVCAVKSLTERELTEELCGGDIYVGQHRNLDGVKLLQCGAFFFLQQFVLWFTIRPCLFSPSSGPSQ